MGVTYEGSYWATKHFSYYIQPGARVLNTNGDNGHCWRVNNACGCADGCSETLLAHQFISFKNPQGDIVIEALNGDDADSPVQISLDGTSVVKATLPAHSMNTFVVKSPQLPAYFI